MALSAKNSEKAFDILKQITGNSQFAVWDKTRPFRTDVILTNSPKDDGGHESIHINIKDITHEQLATWHERKHDIYNTMIEKQVAPGITRLGWF